ncbi:MAG: hypothetical protein JW937_03950, partial [Candidatus Omnitrophica bacterium]|nr:hypothetical protein [Candidatus Omnitrophota bacterium]
MSFARHSRSHWSRFAGASMALVFAFTSINPALAAPAKTFFKDKRIQTARLSQPAPQRLLRGARPEQSAGARNDELGAQDDSPALHISNPGPLEEMQALVVSPEFGRLVRSHWPDDDGVKQVDSRLRGNDMKIILHIQDLHAHPEAQRNSARILEDWLRNQGVRLILSEGAAGKVDTSLVSGFPERGVRARFADLLMDRGELTAEEYLSIVEAPAGLEVWGVEEPELYWQSQLNWMIHTVAREAAAPQLQSLATAVDTLKESIYSPHLRALSIAETSFEDQSWDLGKYVNFLVSEARKRGIDIRIDFPEVDVFVQVQAAEGELDLKALEGQVKSLLQALSQSFSAEGNQEALQALLQRSVDFREGSLKAAEFYQGLAQAAFNSKVAETEAQAVWEYTEYAQLSARIDSTSLMDQMKGLYRAVLEASLETADQQQLAALDSRLQLLRKLFALELNAAEWNEYCQEREHLRAGALHSGIEDLAAAHGVRTQLKIQTLSQILSAYTPFLEKFYQVAEARDHAMVRKTLAKMEELGVDRAALITGGFHTEGLMRLFEEEGLAYHVVAPKATTGQDHARYERILMGERSNLEELSREILSRGSHRASLMFGDLQEFVARQAMALINPATQDATLERLPAVARQSVIAALKEVTEGDQSETAVLKLLASLGATHDTVIARVRNKLELPLDRDPQFVQDLAAIYLYLSRTSGQELDIDGATEWFGTLGSATLNEFATLAPQGFEIIRSDEHDLVAVRSVSVDAEVIQGPDLVAWSVQQAILHEMPMLVSAKLGGAVRFFGEGELGIRVEHVAGLEGRQIDFDEGSKEVVIREDVGQWEGDVAGKVAEIRAASWMCPSLHMEILNRIRDRLVSGDSTVFGGINRKNLLRTGPEDQGAGMWPLVDTAAQDLQAKWPLSGALTNEELPDARRHETPALQGILGMVQDLLKGLIEANEAIEDGQTEKAERSARELVDRAADLGFLTAEAQGQLNARISSGDSDALLDVVEDLMVVLMTDGGFKTRLGVYTLLYGYNGLMPLLRGMNFQELQMLTLKVVSSLLPDEARADFLMWAASDQFLLLGGMTLGDKPLSEADWSRVALAGTGVKQDLMNAGEIEAVGRVFADFGLEEVQRAAEQRDDAVLAQIAGALATAAPDVVRKHREELSSLGVFVADPDTGEVKWFWEKPKGDWGLVKLALMAHENGGQIFANGMLQFNGLEMSRSLNAGMSARQSNYLKLTVQGKVPEQDLRLDAFAVGFHDLMFQSMFMSKPEWMALAQSKVAGFDDPQLAYAYTKDWEALWDVKESVRADWERAGKFIAGLDLGEGGSWMDTGKPPQMQAMFKQLAETDLGRRMMGIELGVNNSSLGGVTLDADESQTSIENTIVTGEGTLRLLPGAKLVDSVIHIPAGVTLVIGANGYVGESHITVQSDVVIGEAVVLEQVQANLATDIPDGFTVRDSDFRAAAELKFYGTNGLVAGYFAEEGDRVDLYGDEVTVVLEFDGVRHVERMVMSLPYKESILDLLENGWTAESQFIAANAAAYSRMTDGASLVNVEGLENRWIAVQALHPFLADWDFADLTEDSNFMDSPRIAGRLSFEQAQRAVDYVSANARRAENRRAIAQARTEAFANAVRTLEIPADRLMPLLEELGIDWVTVEKGAVLNLTLHGLETKEDALQAIFARKDGSRGKVLLRSGALIYLDSAVRIPHGAVLLAGNTRLTGNVIVEGGVALVDVMAENTLFEGLENAADYLPDGLPVDVPEFDPQRSHGQTWVRGTAIGAGTTVRLGSRIVDSWIGAESDILAPYGILESALGLQKGALVEGNECPLTNVYFGGGRFGGALRAENIVLGAGNVFPGFNGEGVVMPGNGHLFGETVMRGVIAVDAGLQEDIRQWLTDGDFGEIVKTLSEKGARYSHPANIASGHRTPIYNATFTGRGFVNMAAGAGIVLEEGATDLPLNDTGVPEFRSGIPWTTFGEFGFPASNGTWSPGTTTGSWWQTLPTSHRDVDLPSGAKFTSKVRPNSLTTNGVNADSLIQVLKVGGPHGVEEALEIFAEYIPDVSALRTKLVQILSDEGAELEAAQAALGDWEAQNEGTQASDSETLEALGLPTVRWTDAQAAERTPLQQRVNLARAYVSVARDTLESDALKSPQVLARQPEAQVRPEATKPVGTPKGRQYHSAADVAELASRPGIHIGVGVKIGAEVDLDKIVPSTDPSNPTVIGDGVVILGSLSEVGAGAQILSSLTDTVVRENARIEGVGMPVTLSLVRAGAHVQDADQVKESDIGAGTYIGPRVKALNTTFGEKCEINGGSWTRSQVGDEVWVHPIMQFIGDAVIGDRVKLGPHVITGNFSAQGAHTVSAVLSDGVVGPHVVLTDGVMVPAQSTVLIPLATGTEITARNPDAEPGYVYAARGAAKPALGLSPADSAYAQAVQRALDAGIPVDDSLVLALGLAPSASRHTSGRAKRMTVPTETAPFTVAASVLTGPAAASLAAQARDRHAELEQAGSPLIMAAPPNE